MKYYLCKFIPPRANFLPTMSADEKELMRQHATFLNDLFDRGLVVAHGPVIDDGDGYGVSLYRLHDDQDVSELTAEDPAVRNGIGHYEHYTMLHLVARP